MKDSLYGSEGKQAFRELLVAVAKQDGLRTYGTFWGSGIDSRLAAASGLDVLAAEVTRSLYPEMDADAAVHGYRVHHGDAARITEHLDMFHADFMGNASGHAFRTLRRIAAITDRWLAVTLASDHQINPWMQGEAALYAVPAWLTGASGFTLEYFGRYVRNRGGQTMFVALLQRRPSGQGQRRELHPVQLARSVSSRSYWANHAFYRQFPGSLPHRNPLYTEREAARFRERYQTDPEYREAMKARSRAHYQANRQRSDQRSREWAKANAERRRQYQRNWYAKKKAAAVSGTAAEAVKAA